MGLYDMVKALICIDRYEAERSAELVEIINQIYKKEVKKVSAVVFGKIEAEVSRFFDEIHLFELAENQLYDARLKADCIKKLQETEQFSSIIIPATQEGRLLAPILAIKLDTGLVADVTAVANEQGKIQMIRPAFDGKIMAAIVNQDETLTMMSVRLGVFKYQKKEEKNAEVIIHEVTSKSTQDIQLLESQEVQTPTDIRDMQVLVSGGGGVINDFSSLHQLAKSLNGMVSASRRLVDSGIAPRSIQVGQSGKIVSPKLYIALGIYGSLQHMEGLKNVEYIISVNLNKHAPICSLSTIVVEGDAMEFIDGLLQKIKQMED